MNALRKLPSVERLLNHSRVAGMIDRFGRKMVVDALRKVLDEIRKAYQPAASIPGETEIIAGAQTILLQWTSPPLFQVINATGVIIHTNLGRAPISREAMEAATEVASGYANLEFDMATGRRGSRLIHTDELLRRLTGAESSLVVNNNAAAVMLVLSALAKRRRVLISRTQLVEIGGGFRIPDVMKQSGAKLVEIGTTNRVHLADYRLAMEEQPIYLVMRAHRSNFAIVGFTSEPSLKEVVDLAHEHGVRFLDDIGSGALVDTAAYGLAHEPMVQESLAAGADLVCFSGDKLLGGPQAGIIVGRGELIQKLRKHPLARALRADKIAIAALSATLQHYQRENYEKTVPVWRMISATTDEIRRRADAWQMNLGTGEVLRGESTIGGGSLPGEVMPTWLYALDVPSVSRFLKTLRGLTPPIIARAHNNRVVLDPRTVLLEQDDECQSGLQRALEDSL